MQRLVAGLVMTIVGLMASPAFAQKVGDIVFVTQDNAPLTDGGKTIMNVSRGEFFAVQEAKGNLLRVGNDPAVWIDKAAVVSRDRAEQHFTSEIQRNAKDAGAYGARGTVRKELGQHDKALADFNEAIKLDPKTASFFEGRAAVWNAKDKYDNAIADLSEALTLGTTHADVVFTGRGHAYRAKDDYDNAIANYDAAIKLNPKFAEAYINRGLSYQDKGDYAKALADFNETIKLDPANVDGYNNLAWLYATCPDAKLRNGQQALKHAAKAHSLIENLPTVDTLAAACAEAGDFANAVKWQSKAIDLAPPQDKPDFRARLALYKSGKAYRDELKR